MILLRSARDLDIDAVERIVEERFGNRFSSNRGGEDDEFDQIPDDVAQESLLPDVKSPNLWPVRCRIGEEKQTALLLMRKFLSLDKTEKVTDRTVNEKQTI